MTGKEKGLREMIKHQEHKIESCQKKIAALNKELEDYLASQPPKPEPFAVLPKEDHHDYCGKILYPSEKAAHAARKLINRDLLKVGKAPMRRAYFCDRCEAWHLTTILQWIPFPENETNTVK